MSETIFFSDFTLVLLGVLHTGGQRGTTCILLPVDGNEGPSAKEQGAARWRGGGLAEASSGVSSDVQGVTECVAEHV